MGVRGMVHFLEGWIRIYKLQTASLQQDKTGQDAEVREFPTQTKLIDCFPLLPPPRLEETRIQRDVANE